MKAKVKNYINASIEDHIDKIGKINLTGIEEDVMAEFDVSDLDEIEEDLSFKIFNYIKRVRPELI